MKRLSNYIFILLMTIGLLVGCASNENSSQPEESMSDTTTEETQGQEGTTYPLTVEDSAGNEVVLEEDPERIVSLIPSNTEIVFAVDAGEQVVGVSDHDNYPEQVKEIDRVGGMQINTEKVLSLKPDLVLAHGSSAHNSQAALDQISNAGIPVYVVKNASDFKGVYETIHSVGKLVNEQEKADSIVTGMKDKLKGIKEKASEIKDPKSVFVEVSPAPEIYTTGTGTFMHHMLQAINAENAAANQEGWVKMNEEAIINLQPDVIITTYGYYTEKPVEKVLSREGWEEVPANEKKQVYDVHSDLVTRAGPRLIEGIERLAEAVYPETFGDE
ncbi:ABC transporter substrate-binding protein [Halobacillus shinanisalinarum]|uniref:ABC transporter substrate-binding protein n=1 Tax=Halobacillus shinanisalinarum TaxID=2932258 RepID=A0ABY4H4M1_9BACI|nr:ABC transporter substrate-binding protein [Halobacillus shinanisalinarum]UOQ95410.1 ABC transporter substrate-binding protein [Halobacillus shinanisalinarum]